MVKKKKKMKKKPPHNNKFKSCNKSLHSFCVVLHNPN